MFLKLGKNYPSKKAVISSLKPKAWFKSTEIQQEDNTEVSTWKDISGNGYDAEQSTSANRPTYRTNQINGKPALVFDGVNDRLSIPSSTETFKFLHSDLSTLFIIVKAGVVADPNAQYLIIGNTEASTTNIGYDIRYDDRASVNRNNFLNHVVTKGVSGVPVVGNQQNDEMSANEFHILRISSDPANATASERSYMQVDNGTVRKNNTFTNATSTSDASFDLTIGTSSPNATSFLLNGAIAEIIIFNRALTNGELSLVHQYLKQEYAI